MAAKSKYHNIKTTTIDGTVFDSRKEARRWEALRIREQLGEITELKRQVPYELIPAQYETYERYSKTGKRLKDGERMVERNVVYVADFVYTTTTGQTVVEDTKGVRTKDYAIKRKLMYAIYGIKITEI